MVPKGLPQLSDDEVRFLSQIRRYATNLNDSDRKLVLAMVKKMASNSGSEVRPSAISSKQTQPPAIARPPAEDHCESVFG